MMLVMTTVPDAEAAADLADKIVNARLAACVQILPPMTSVFVWDGAVQRESENLLLIKTLEDGYERLEAFIRENHEYEVPEIAAFEAERVSADYLSWMRTTIG